jgi:predicted nucleic acid-binding protein
MMRIFLDSNVLISAALFPSTPVALVVGHVLESHTLILSTWTMAECREVFTRKFPARRESLEAFFAELEFERFETPASIDPASYPAIRDPKDIPELASAILSDSDILITGDRDLFEMEQPPKRPLIFSPGDYMKLI